MTLCLHQHGGQRRYVFRVFVHPCMSPERTLLAGYLGYLLMEFDQTFTTDDLLGKDKCINFGGQKVKVIMGSNVP